MTSSHLAVTPPALDAYDDYRLYLRDLMEAAAPGPDRIPLSRFAKAFGLSRSHLSMVLSGDRGLSLGNIHGIAHALHLKQSDHERWEALVLFGQAKDDFERNYYRGKLGFTRRPRATSAISTPSRALVAAWYIPALLVYLIDIGAAEADLAVLAAKLRIDDAALQRTIAALQDEGLLAFRQRGSVHISFNRLTTLVSNKRFLRQVFEEGLRQLDSQFTSDRCFFNGTTFSVAEDDIQQFIADYKVLLDRYITAAPGNGVKRIVQANIQFFPVL